MAQREKLLERLGDIKTKTVADYTQTDKNILEEVSDKLEKFQKSERMRGWGTGGRDY